MPSTSCLDPVKLKEIASIFSAGQSAAYELDIWTERKDANGEECDYRMETVDFSKAFQAAIKANSFDIEMQVEKRPRQRYMHLKYG